MLQAIYGQIHKRLLFYSEFSIISNFRAIFKQLNLINQKMGMYLPLIKGLNQKGIKKTPKNVETKIRKKLYKSYI